MPADLPLSDLAAMKARCEAATNGPWFYFGEALFGELTFPDGSSASGVGLDCCRGLSFAAHSRTDLPRVIAAYEAVVAERDGLRAELEFTEAQRDCAKGALDRMVKVTTVGPKSAGRIEMSSKARTFEQLRIENQQLRVENARESAKVLQQQREIMELRTELERGRG